MSARYQNPMTSRWMSADPAGAQLINPNRKGFSLIESLNWYGYCSNNPIKYMDPSGLDDLVAIFNKSSGDFYGLYIPTNDDGRYDFNNTTEFDFSGSNNVRNELNGQRDSPDVKTSPTNGEASEYYFPRDFPTGEWEASKSIKIPDDHPSKKYLGDVFVPTNATQDVPTYGTDIPKKNADGKYESSGAQNDGGYGVHYSPSTTLGCINAGTQSNANTYAGNSDKAIDSGGTSYLIVVE